MTIAELTQDVVSAPADDFVTIPRETWARVVSYIQRMNRLEEYKKRVQEVKAGDYITLDEWEEDMDLA